MVRLVGSQLVLLGWMGAEAMKVTVRSVSSEVVSAGHVFTPMLLPEEQKSMGQAGDVTVFIGEDASSGKTCCGVVGQENTPRVGETVELDACAADEGWQSPRDVFLALCAAAATQSGYENVAVLGGGPTGTWLCDVLESMGTHAVHVAPSRADEDAPIRGRYLFVDMAGAESLRRVEYLSLVSAKTHALIDDGMFGKPRTDWPKLRLDTKTCALALATVVAAPPPAKKKTTTAPTFRLPFFTDEYADFMAWPRDADNRGRRIGLEILYDDASTRSPFLLSKLAVNDDVHHADIVHHPNNHRDLFAKDLDGVTSSAPVRDLADP